MWFCTCRWERCYLLDNLRSFLVSVINEENRKGISPFVQGLLTCSPAAIAILLTVDNVQDNERQVTEKFKVAKASVDDPSSQSQKLLVNHLSRGNALALGNGEEISGLSQGNSLLSISELEDEAKLTRSAEAMRIVDQDTSDSICEREHIVCEGTLYQRPLFHLPLSKVGNFEASHRKVAIVYALLLWHRLENFESRTDLDSVTRDVLSETKNLLIDVNGSCEVTSFYERCLGPPFKLSREALMTVDPEVEDYDGKQSSKIQSEIQLRESH